MAGKKQRRRQIGKGKRAIPTCVYCRAAPGTTEDHVFPKSWYPTTTPPDVKKATVPACSPCNKRWKRIEESFAVEYLFVLDSSAPEVAGVSERISRAWQVQKAKDPRDAKHRMGKALKLARTMKWVAPVPNAPQQVIRTPAGLYVKASPARGIEATLRRSIAEKFIRGFHFLETGQPASDFKLDCVSRTNAALAKEQSFQVLLGAMTRREHLAPGLFYGWYDGAAYSFWAFHLWGQLTLLAFASPPLATSGARSAGS